MAGQQGHWLRTVPLQNPKRAVHGASGVYLSGLEEVVNNLNAIFAEMKGNVSIDALVDAAHHVNKVADTKLPKIPVDTGALRASWFVASSRGDETGKRSYKGPRPTTYKKKRTGGFLKQTRPATIAEARINIGAAGQVVIAGYSMPYAAFIHEGITGHYQAVKWSRPGSGRWFLQEAFNGSKNELIKIISKNLEIK